MLGLNSLTMNMMMMSTVETCVGLGSSKDLLGDVQGGGAGDLNLAQVQVQTCSFLSGLTCIPSSCRNIATRPTLDRSDPSWDISIAKISGLPFVGGFGADSGQRPKHSLATLSLRDESPFGNTRATRHLWSVIQ